MAQKKSNGTQIIRNIIRVCSKIIKLAGIYIKEFNKFLKRFYSYMRIPKPKDKNGKVKVLHWRNMMHFFLLSFVFVYYELLLRIFNKTGLFSHLIYPVLFGLALGIFCNVFTTLLNKKINWIITLVIMTISAIIFGTECLVRNTFQVYMTISSILSGAGGVAGTFTGDMITQIIGGLGIIFLYLLPIILYGILGRRFMPAYRYRWPVAAMNIVLSIAVFTVGVLFASIGSTGKKYKTQFEFNNATETFGLITSLRLNGSRSSSGLTTVIEDDDGKDSKDKSDYGQNVLDIDFSKKAEEESDPTFKEMNEYVASLKPSSKNKYTGIFKDKNLILICAEAFSDAAINKDLTPTLYRMQQQGINFTKYYQPTWGGSTSTGEYSFLVGMVPTQGVDSIQYTIGHNNYYTLGNQMQRIGYMTACFHNGTNVFYSRNETHENLGFNYFLADGNGLEDLAQSPLSDETMFHETFETYKDLQPFCMYYMSLNGHSPYTLGNFKTDNNLEAVEKVLGNDVTDTVKYYYCFQMELERALTTLIKDLEENGMMDDTIICLTSDHYPYGLSEGVYGNTVDYVADLYGGKYDGHTGQDHNSWLLWSTCLEEGGELAEYSCKVKTPTYSLDIVPTLSNLFGLEYDSRLMIGRDVFSDQKPLVIWNDYSWLTDKGFYDSHSGQFKAKKDVKVDDDYVDKMSTIVRNRINFSDQMLMNDYYNYLFGKDEVVDSTSLWEEKYKNGSTSTDTDTATEDTTTD